MDTRQAIKTAATVGIVLIVILGGFAIWAHQSVDEGYVGVETERNAMTGTVYEPGWEFINPVTQNIHDIETRPRVVTYHGDQRISVITEDGQDVFVDVTIRYRVDNESATTFFREYRDHEQAVNRVIEPTVRSELRDQGSAISARNVITREGREALADSVAESLRENFDGTGLTLEAVQVRDVQPNEDFSNQLEEIEIENAQKEQRLIEANATAEAEIIEAEGDAEAARIRDSELTDEVLMDKYLDSVENADTVILTTNDEGTPVILERGEDGSIDADVNSTNDSGNGGGGQ